MLANLFVESLALKYNISATGMCQMEFMKPMLCLIETGPKALTVRHMYINETGFCSAIPGKHFH